MKYFDDTNSPEFFAMRTSMRLSRETLARRLSVDRSTIFTWETSVEPNADALGWLRALYAPWRNAPNLRKTRKPAGTADADSSQP